MNIAAAALFVLPSVLGCGRLCSWLFSTRGSGVTTATLSFADTAAIKLRTTFGRDRLSMAEAQQIGQFCVSALLPLKGHFSTHNAAAELPVERQRLEIFMQVYTTLGFHLSRWDERTDQFRGMMSVLLRLLDPETMTTRDLVYTLSALTDAKSRVMEEDVLALLHVLQSRSRAFQTIEQECFEAWEAFVTLHPRFKDMTYDEAIELSWKSVPGDIEDQAEMVELTNARQASVADELQIVSDALDNTVLSSTSQRQRIAPRISPTSGSRVYVAADDSPRSRTKSPDASNLSPYSFNESEWSAALNKIRMGVLSRMWGGAALLLFSQDGVYRNIFPMTRMQVQRISTFLGITPGESYKEQLQLAGLLAGEVVMSLRGDTSDVREEVLSFDGTLDTEGSSDKSQATLLNHGAEAKQRHVSVNSPSQRYIYIDTQSQTRRDRETSGEGSQLFVRTAKYVKLSPALEEEETVSFLATDLIQTARALVARGSEVARLSPIALSSLQQTYGEDSLDGKVALKHTVHQTRFTLHPNDAVSVAECLARCGTATGHYNSHLGIDDQRSTIAEAIGLSLALHVASTDPSVSDRVMTRSRDHLLHAAEWVVASIRDPALASFVQAFMRALAHQKDGHATH